MALHAVGNIGDAVTATRKFLFPFELRRWLKLAFVVFFLGGGMSLPTVQFDMPSSVDPTMGSELPALPADTMTVIAVAVGAAVLLGLLFSLVGAIMEFVFVESLRTGDVSIRRHWGNRWRQGLRLFGFRLAISIPMLAVVFGWLGLLFVPFLFAEVEHVVSFGMLFVIGLPIVFVVGLVYALATSFTTVFVVPIMIKIDRGVLGGWRLLWRSIKANPKQYLVYAVLGFALTIAAGILASILVGLAALVLLLPLVLFGLVLHLTVSFASTAAVIALVALAALVLLAIFLLWLLAQVPVVAYLRYYALLVLGDIDDSFELIPEQRSEIRQPSDIRG